MAESGEDLSSAGRKMKNRAGVKNHIRKRLVCFRRGKEDKEGEEDGRIPTHLVIMINGIIGSAKDWRFAEKQFIRTLGDDVIVHCSARNRNLQTLKGVDVMGTRLAKEVESIVKDRPELKKISFVGHSLGGLVARYAIAVLYEHNPSEEDADQSRRRREEGKIAGLEPMNFVTFATPHVGSRWHKQIPVLCGVGWFEKMARRSSWAFGRTGRQLFLDDDDGGRPPLLVQMVQDSGDLLFISALRSFRRRVLYANARFDYIVGWNSSSIRHQHELPKLKVPRGIEGYPHIIRVEPPKEVNLDQDASIDIEKKTRDLQEEMINSLNKVSWERVDVSFKRTMQRFLAHNTIQVKTRCLNSAGSDVISHLMDNFLL